MLEDQKVPDKLCERPILILSGSPEFLQKLELPECERELVVFDLTVDRKGCEGLSVNRRIFDRGQFVKLRCVVEKNKRDDRQNGYHQHQGPLIFSENLNHKI